MVFFKIKLDKIVILGPAGIRSSSVVSSSGFDGEEAGKVHGLRNPYTPLNTHKRHILLRGGFFTSRARHGIVTREGREGPWGDFLVEGLGGL